MTQKHKALRNKMTELMIRAPAKAESHLRPYSILLKYRVIKKSLWTWFLINIGCKKNINDILKPFLTKFSDTDKRIGYFQQDGATANTSNASLTFLQIIFGSRIISINLWPPKSLDLTLPDIYLWGAMKNKIYCSNPRSINELKETITDYIQKVDNTVLKDVLRNMMIRASM